MEDLLEYIVNYARNQGADYAEARYQKINGASLTFINGKVDNVSTISFNGIGVRVNFKDSFGVASTNILTKEKLTEVCNKAIKFAKAKKIKRELKLEKEKEYIDTVIVKPKINLKNKSLDEIIEEFKEYDNLIAQKEPRIVYRFFSIYYYDEEKFYVNSDGAKIEQTWPYINIFRILTAVDPQKGFLQRMFSDGGKEGWEILERIKFKETIVDESETLGKILDKGESFKEPGYYDIIIDGEISGLIAHEACGHPFEADRILGREAAQGGESYVNVDMLKKEKIGSDVLTIIDNPLLEKASGFYVYDEEGIPARPKYLIKDGIINEFLLNREYAYLLGLKSNGSARVSYYFNEPLIRMSNTYIEPKDYKFEELIEDISKGIYFKSYMEWNIDDRRWNQKYGGLECYLIENGEIKKPLRNVKLEITTGTLFKNIDAVGKEMKYSTGSCGKGEPMQGVPVWFGGPAIRVRRVWIK